MLPATIALILEGKAKKGDVLATARIAGIMAAKKTQRPDPALPSADDLQGLRRFRMELDVAAIDVAATVKVEGKTGVEMEALTACSVACLTLYDMLKAVDRGMRITDLRLVEKTGGKSGTYHGGLTWRCCPSPKRWPASCRGRSSRRRKTCRSPMPWAGCWRHR